MEPAFGVLFAFGALLFWGFGDFLIQKSTRRVGDWESMFLIAAFGAAALTPFVYSEITAYANSRLILFFFGSSAVYLLATIINFEALKEGKIAVVEPIYVLEIPTTMLIAIVVISEVVTATEALFVIIIMVGLVLVSTKAGLARIRKLEEGVALGVASAILIGVCNFLLGFGSRITNPLIVNWFIDVGLAAYSGTYLLHCNKLHKLASDIRKLPALLFGMSAIDNMAWVSYTFSTIFIPISIAVAISQNYIAIAALLGLAVGKEKILLHQKVGLVVALAGAVALASLV